MNWQPIETAPRDGTEILLSVGESYVGGYVCIAYWDTEPSWHWKGGGPCWTAYKADDDFYSHYIAPDRPTHWMPKPDMPK